MAYPRNYRTLGRPVAPAAIVTTWWLMVAALIAPVDASAQTNSGWDSIYQASAWSPAIDNEQIAYRAYLDADEDVAESDPAEDGDDRNVADRLDRLEQNFESLEEDYGSLKEEYESLAEDYDSLQSTLKKVVYPGHGAATMKVNGRIHADMWAFPGDSPGVNAFESGDPTVTPQDRVGFRRVRFGVKGDLWKTMLYRIEMEFAGGNDSEFRDVFIGWKDLPVLQQVLIGNQKRPYGLDHLNSSRYNVFMERPFVIEAFNQDARRFGVVSYGFTEDQAWNWRYGVYNMRLIQDEGNYISDHWQPEFAGRLAHTCWYDECSDGRGYAGYGISGTFAHPDGSAALFPERASNEAEFRTRPEARSQVRWLDTGAIAGADNYRLLGLEGVVNVGEWQIVGEYQNVWMSRDPGFGPDLHFHGGYMYVSYFLTGETMPWDRETGTLARIQPLENFFLVDTCHDGVAAGWGAWQIAVRGSYADLTDDNIAGGIGESVTFGLNWYWNAYSRMQFNYLYGNIHDHAPVAGQTFGNYNILGTRFMVDF